MSEFFKFAGDSPWIAFFLVCVLSNFLVRIFVQLPNRILRHWNIRKHGYPPPHCDADGDFKSDPAEAPQ